MGLSGCMRFRVVSRIGAGETGMAHPKLGSKQAPGPAMLPPSLPSASPGCGAVGIVGFGMCKAENLLVSKEEVDSREGSHG